MDTKVNFNSASKDRLCLKMIWKRKLFYWTRQTDLKVDLKTNYKNDMEKDAKQAIQKKLAKRNIQTNHLDSDLKFFSYIGFTNEAC